LESPVTPSSPLRNRIRLDLDASPSDVWALVGDLARFPEYSAGLERVDATVDEAGNCTDYLCRFRPPVEGEQPILHRELMRWIEPGRGWASVAEEPNAFGSTDALTLVILEPRDGGSRLTWEQYYEAADLPMLRDEFDRALTDIAARLTERFGGTLTERYVEGNT
jgi:Polyketide cyclase / dehydrase and lipid transport